MKTGICLVFLLCLFVSCNKLKDYFPVPHPKPQPLPQFNKLYGGTRFEEPNAIIGTKDGGYLMAARTLSMDGDVTGFHGTMDAWVVKLNSEGNIMWQRALGGSHDDLANAVTTCLDGGYIMAGYTFSNDGDVSGNHGGVTPLDAWVVRMGENGTILWQKALGGTGTDVAEAIYATKDSGFIMAGTTDSNDGDVSGNHGDYDYWVVKLDKDGNKLWQKTLGGTRPDLVSSIIAADGGYIIIGDSESNDGNVSGNHGGYDAWVVQLDEKGNKVWQKTFGGTSFDQASSLIARIDGSYVLAGTTYSNDGDVGGNHGDADVWVFTLKDE